MWNRQRLKRNARVLLKANYLKVVVVGLILSFLIGSGYNSARGAAKSNDVDIDVTDLFSGNLAFIVAMLIGIAGVIAIALLFNVVLNIFLWNPLEVGCRKVFVDCRYGNAEFICIQERIWTYWSRDVHERFVYIFVDTALYYSGHHQGI